MTKTEIKELAKNEVKSALKYYEVDDFAIEELTEKEKETFFQEFEKLKNKLLKSL